MTPRPLLSSQDWGTPHPVTALCSTCPQHRTGPDRRPPPGTWQPGAFAPPAGPRRLTHAGVGHCVLCGPRVRVVLSPCSGGTSPMTSRRLLLHHSSPPRGRPGFGVFYLPLDAPPRESPLVVASVSSGSLLTVTLLERGLRSPLVPRTPSWAPLRLPACTSVLFPGSLWSLCPLWSLVPRRYALSGQPHSHIFATVTSQLRDYLQLRVQSRIAASAWASPSSDLNSGRHELSK